jgi:uncharacterized membrane protein YsdA (DUF1294 family)
MIPVLLYILAINLAAFGAFALDKRAAERGDWRIRERTLLLLAAAGGSAGAITAQKTLRHKTKKQPFATWLLLIVVAQAALAGAALWFWIR